MLKEYEQKFQGKRIMITGGLGFIGSNLAHRLLELNPSRIIIVDSMIPGLGANLNNVKDIKDRLEIPNLDLEKGGVDISDSEKIKEILDCQHLLQELPLLILFSKHQPRPAPPLSFYPQQES